MRLNESQTNGMWIAQCVSRILTICPFVSYPSQVRTNDPFGHKILCERFCSRNQHFCSRNEHFCSQPVVGLGALLQIESGREEEGEQLLGLVRD